MAAFYASLQLRQHRYRWRFFSLVLLFFVVEMVMEGNRIFIAVFLLSIISSCWLFGRKKVIAGILLVAPLIAFAFVAWASLRSSLTNIEENFAGYLTTDIGNRTETTLIDAFDGTGSMLLLHVVNDFGREHPYLYGLSYSRALTFVIPRSVYPQRPESFSLMLADTYEPGQETSLSSTVLGEMYANFGPFSMLLLPLFTAVLISLHNRLIARRERYVLLSSVSFVLMIWHVRIAFAETFVSFLLCGVVIWGLSLESGLSLQGYAC